MRSGWGKRDSTGRLPPSAAPAKRRWNALNGAFGKRSPVGSGGDEADDSATAGVDVGHPDSRLDGAGDNDSRERRQRSYTAGGSIEANKRGWRQLNGAYGKRVGELLGSMA